ncbi:MAG: IclR family transcriptional regulator [Chloroflexi bacterium]|nr:IclR family transcriptional regulator [Chloroflexota bacterium]
MSREVQSLARGLDILLILSENGDAMGVTQIAQALDIDKSSAFRLLSTLAGRGFVEQVEETRRYQVGLRIVELSRRALDRIELRSVAKPSLGRLKESVGESAHLAVLVDGQVMYVETVESGANLNVNTEIGRRGPLHCTATGKALVAHLPLEELERLFEGVGLKRYTPRTLLTLRELAPHLEVVRERGYAVDDEEFDPGVRCVAAPLRDYRGKVVASVGVSGPTVRVSLDQIPEIARFVVDTASEISRLLGFAEGS